MSLTEISHGWTLCKSAFGMQSVHVTAYLYAIIQWYSVLAYLQYTMNLSGILLTKLESFTVRVFT